MYEILLIAMLMMLVGMPMIALGLWFDLRTYPKKSITSALLITLGALMMVAGAALL